MSRYTCEATNWNVKKARGVVSDRSQTTGYASAIEELKAMELDAKANRAIDDPQENSIEWIGFMKGIDCAIRRLKMNDA